MPRRPFVSKTRYNLDLVFANVFFGANFSFYVSLTRNYLDFQQIFMLQVLSAAVNAIRHADMLIIGGTSLTVYPAAGLVDYYEGNKLVLINKSVTAKEAHADLVITEPIGQVFQRCVLGEKCSEDAQTSDRR